MTVPFTFATSISPIPLSNLDANFAAVGNSSNVTYTPPFTGGVAESVSAKLAQTVSVKDFGAVGDGVTDDKAAIQAALNAVDTVQFPDGTYLLGSKVNLNSNNVLIGSGATILWNASSFANAIEGSAVTNVAIEGLKFESSMAVTASETYGIKVTDCQQVKVTNCQSSSVNLFLAASSGANYAAVVTDETNVGFNCSADIVVSNCIVDGPGQVSQASQGGIYMQYVQRFAVTNCVVKNAGHGVQYYGGDSNPAVNGAVANERKCKLGSISNCVIENIEGGGVFGSMGDGIVVSSCSVKNCNDVGIDFEGSNNCAATGNYLSNCVNGGLTNFFFCRSIVFSGNTVVQSTATYPAYRCYNSSLTTDNKSVTLTGNTFNCTDSNVGSVDWNNGPSETINVTGNTFINTVLYVVATNLKYVNIVGNSLLFPTANSIAFTGIRLSGVVGQGVSNIKNNVVVSDVVQPSGSTGIFVSGNDFNFVDVHTIESNTTLGFLVDIKTDNYGTNAGVGIVFNIINNCFGVPNYLRVESGAANSTVNFDGNTYNGLPYPSTTPVAGRWDRGTKLYYATPSSGGFIGEVCVTAGAPGTWKTFGVIS
jgi:Pectate lyase superfamily protein